MCLQLFRTTFWTRHDTPPEDVVMERYKQIGDKGYVNPAASPDDEGKDAGMVDTDTGVHQVTVSVISGGDQQPSSGNH